jgi:hypothetical protein
MGSTLAIVALLCLAGCGYALAVWVGPKVGLDTSQLPRMSRRASGERVRHHLPWSVAVGIALIVVAVCVAVWGFADGKPIIGVVAVVALAILPEGLFIPVRRSRARRSGAAMRGRDKHTDTPA